MRFQTSFLVSLLLTLPVFGSLEPPTTADDAELMALEARAARSLKKRATNPPAKAPVKAPAPAPAKAPVKAPAAAPAKAPAAAPVKAPAQAPAKAPVKAPAQAPAKAPAKAPANVPAKAPAPPPAAKAPSKAPAKAPTKAPAKAPAKAKKSCQAQITKALQARYAEFTLNRHEARAGLAHPSGKGRVTLFHGTDPSKAASLTAGVNLAKTAPTGDFNHKPEVPGGFYLTDSVIAAAQFACWGAEQGEPAKVDVFEYAWDGVGAGVFEFPGQTPDWLEFLFYNSEEDTTRENVDDDFRAQAVEIYKNKVMITGPMNGQDDELITNEFQQYAIINQAAVTSRLRLVARHQNIVCKNVPQADALTTTLYTKGQGGNPSFQSLLTKLQNPNLVSALESC
ncbi:hypothetical protein MIND_00301700 [Mycena indigotica]|uniref:Uncharacterized protein n=1 Tax=Mycena indigotica TaxID=2126181 RepID=A0A8H6W845_9AGAR|nr:uncharacterized protein MIND_00301700 [Mycena indigotica]KAF7309314.1 hypothetical protein MIND_00301700 [Mycena indigotica]